MKVSGEVLDKISNDLSLNTFQDKGVTVRVRNCWHFCSDGKAVDVMFYDEIDFQDGINCIYILSRKFKIIILSFVLMDNHFHFVLYGEYEECKRFVNEFTRRTAMRISFRHKVLHPLERLPISAQKIDSQNYLKTVICYVVKNPTTAGKRYNHYDYPWSSGSLYFRSKSEESWCVPDWILSSGPNEKRMLKYREKRSILKTHDIVKEAVGIRCGIVTPDAFVAYEIVESLFRTPKSFSYFIGKNRDEVDEKGGQFENLSIPWKEMRQNKEKLCQELFGSSSIRGLSTRQRLTLAKMLKAKYRCSIKQIARLSGLVYEEVSELI